MKRGWWEGQAEALGRALILLRTAPWVTVVVTLVLATALALPATMAWIGAGVTQWFGGQGTEPQITAFFRQKLDREEALAVVQRWRKDEAVSRIVFISREEALARLRQTDLGAAIETLPENPLPDAMTVVPRRHTPQDVAELQQRLAAEAGIEAVQVDTAWVERVHGLARAGTMVAAALAAWFALGMLAQTYLAIRLQLVAAAQEISVLRALGATDGYIGRPFRWLGWLQGLLAGAVGAALWGGLIAWLTPPFDELARLYGLGGFFPFPVWAGGVALAAAGAVLGALGAEISLRQFFRAST